MFPDSLDPPSPSAADHLTTRASRRAGNLLRDRVNLRDTVEAPKRATSSMKIRFDADIEAMRWFTHAPAIDRNFYCLGCVRFSALPQWGSYSRSTYVLERDVVDIARN